MLPDEIVGHLRALEIGVANARVVAALKNL